MSTTDIITLPTYPEDLVAVRDLIRRRIDMRAEVVAARCVSRDLTESMYLVLWVYRYRSERLVWGTHAALVGVAGSKCEGMIDLLWGHYHQANEGCARQDWSMRT